MQVQLTEAQKNAQRITELEALLAKALGGDDGDDGDDGGGDRKRGGDGDGDGDGGGGDEEDYDDEDESGGMVLVGGDGAEAAKRELEELKSKKVEDDARR
jgi:hypothetical protein